MTKFSKKTNHKVSILAFSILGVAVIGILYKVSQLRRPPTWEERKLKTDELELKLKATSEQMGQYAGLGSCRSDSECRVTGLGAKVCGEYRDYFIYSITEANEPRLLPLIEEFNRYATELQNLNLSVPNCGKKPSSIRCINGACKPLPSDY